MALRVAVRVDKLKPSITGWAQINARDEIFIEAEVAFQKEYLEKKSVWFDFGIVEGLLLQYFLVRGVAH